jgi:hypothetical protein
MLVATATVGTVFFIFVIPLTSKPFGFRPVAPNDTLNVYFRDAR